MKSEKWGATCETLRVRRWFVTVGLLVAVVSATASAPLFAQDVNLPIPGADYPGAAAGPERPPLPDPGAILEQDGSSFSIPIPGGGEIQVQGPQSETPHTIPPIENWATRRNTPFSPGGTPMGPAPH